MEKTREPAFDFADCRWYEQGFRRTEGGRTAVVAGRRVMKVYRWRCGGVVIKLNYIAL